MDENEHDEDYSEVVPPPQDDLTFDEVPDFEPDLPDDGSTDEQGTDEVHPANATPRDESEGDA